MLAFITELKFKNPTLFYYGIVCLLLAVVFFICAQLTTTEVYGVKSWYKPLKFALSTFIFSWSIAWYCYYLPNFNASLFSWTVILLLGFEIVYIAIKAGQGLTSHYNVSTPLNAFLFQCMALAATIVTLYAAYVGLLFFKHSFPTLPSYYVWAIRLGIVLFVIFSFEGFVMGSKFSHTVGAANDNSNIFILGWSKTFGDLRIAHFIGMHALQVLPILSFYVLKNTKLTIAAAVLYGLLAFTTLFQALQGKPLFSSRDVEINTSQWDRQ